MIGLIKFLEWELKIMLKYLSPRNQLLLGILLCNLSIPLFVYGFFIDEPFFVYQMSAGAIFLNGIGIVVAAQALVEVTPGATAS